MVWSSWSIFAWAARRWRGLALAGLGGLHALVFEMGQQGLAA
jgi:hypothetical protein